MLSNDQHKDILNALELQRRDILTRYTVPSKDVTFFGTNLEGVQGMPSDIRSDISLRLDMMDCVLDAIVEMAGIDSKAVLTRATQLYRELASKKVTDESEIERNCDSEFRDKLARDRANKYLSKLEFPDDSWILEDVSNLVSKP